MNPGSPLNKASDFWSGGGISDLIRGFFNCDCAYKRRSPSRPSKSDVMQEEEQSGSAWKYSYFVDNDNAQRPSPPKNNSPQESVILTFEQTLKKIRVEDKPPEFIFDDVEDQLRQPSMEEPSVAASRNTDEQPKHNEHEDGLSSASKKISKKAKKSEEEKKGSQARRPWQPYEDKLVLELYEELGPSWAAISRRMDGIRTGKQIRDRYLGKLDPKIKNAEWTQKEDDLLVSLFHKFGKKWCEIAKNIPGRTESQVKNRVQWRYKWMLEDNPVMPEQLPPTTKKSKKTEKRQKGSNSRAESKSNLMVSEESSKNFLFDNIDLNFTSDPIPQDKQQINPAQRDSFPNFALFSESSMLSDFANFDPQNGYYHQQQSRPTQYDSNSPSAERVEKMKYEKKQFISNAMEEEFELPRDKGGLYMNGPKQNLENQSNWMHLESSMGQIDPPNTNTEKSIEDKINYLTTLLQNLPGSNNYSESLRKIHQDNNRGLSNEEATRRVEELKNRLHNLEMLLQLAYKEVLNTNGLQNARM